MYTWSSSIIPEHDLCFNITLTSFKLARGPSSSLLNYQRFLSSSLACPLYPAIWNLDSLYTMQAQERWTWTASLQTNKNMLNPVPERRTSNPCTFCWCVWIFLSGWSSEKETQFIGTNSTAFMIEIPRNRGEGRNFVIHIARNQGELRKKWFFFKSRASQSNLVANQGRLNEFREISTGNGGEPRSPCKFGRN